MSFFSHGQSQRYSSIYENQLVFAYGIKNLGEEGIAETDINFHRAT